MFIPEGVNGTLTRKKYVTLHRTLHLNRMASGLYVAFDLDNTLGFFELTNPLAYLWSPEFLRNPEQSAPNSPLQVSKKLRIKLQKARKTFVELLAKKEELLWLILRPNLPALMDHLVAAWRAGRVRAVVIYSNTSVSYSMELGAALIEKAFGAPGLFRLAADHWSPLRAADRTAPPAADPNAYVEPLKTVETLRVLLRKAVAGASGSAASAAASRSSSKPIPLKKVMFVDDRRPKHALAAQEEEGLTYLVPSHYRPSAASVPLIRRQQIFALAIEAMNLAGLLYDKEYLESGFCHRDIPYNWTKIHHVRGVNDLLHWVWSEIVGVRLPREGWREDTAELVAAALEFFGPTTTLL
jgi:hypothetical protein